MIECCHHLQIASRPWNYRMTVIAVMTLQLIYLFIPRVQLYIHAWFAIWAGTSFRVGGVHVRNFRIVGGAAFRSHDSLLATLTMADLLLACKKGDFAKAVELIQQGRDPHYKKPYYWQTPLHFACRYVSHVRYYPTTFSVINPKQ